MYQNFVNYKLNNDLFSKRIEQFKKVENLIEREE
jgi:hypothetical protein